MTNKGKIWGKRWLTALMALLAFAIPTPALAQATAEEYTARDERGVDLVTGSYNTDILEGRIGPDGGGVSLIRYYGRAGFGDNWSGDLRRTTVGGVETITIRLGQLSERFALQGAVWVSARAVGATLTETIAGAEWEYRSGDGTRIIYRAPRAIGGAGFGPFLPTAPLGTPENPTVDMPSIYCNSSNATACGLPVRVDRPNGQDHQLTWYAPMACTGDIGGGGPNEPSQVCSIVYRLQDVRSASGYALKISYGDDGGPGGGVWPNPPSGPPPQWFERTGARFFELSQVYCDPAAFNCNSVTAAATVTYAYPSPGVFDIVNSVSGTTRMTNYPDGTFGIRRPGASSDTTTVTYSGGRVSQVVEDGTTRTYATTTGATNTTTVTDVGAGGGSGNMQYGPAQPVPASGTDETGATTTYLYDANNRVIRETAPQGNYVQYTRDARGNVTETRAVAIAGSGLADIVTTASYDATCANPLTCNQPNYTIDARDNRTDYTYSPTHGQVTRIQLPAPTSGGARPEVNYTYTALFAQVRDAANVLVNLPDAQYRPTLITSCINAATCASTANEQRVTIAYATSNLLATSVTTANGTNTISAATAYAYDTRDNLISVDGPLAGTGDTTTFIYDSLNRRRGVIGPDPDGAGARVRVAERYTFDADSRVTRVERGTVNAATDAALTAMTALQTLDILYDANGRVIRQTASASGTTFGVTQSSYDAQGRPTCTALRMNPATWAALPADACTAATAGAEGPDRITRTSYDLADRPILVESGVGSTAAATEVATSYTANGRTAWVQDGENNRTSYVYDGHDRLSQTRYPLTTVGAQASDAVNYEQLSYDPGGNVTQRRLRDGQVMGYTYDALSRLIARDLPGTEPDATYVYNLAGMLTSAVQNSLTLSFTYDALGRQLNQVGPNGTMSSVWDVAGRRTRLNYPTPSGGGNLYITYTHDTLGNTLLVRENTGSPNVVTTLATYAYDALGRRSSVTFGNGTVQSFGFDAASQLTSLTNNLAGTASDQTLGFTYNPAGQIATNTRSNDSFAWGGHYNIDRLTSVDGLNRILQNGTVTMGYDGRGNLTSSGTSAYTYNADNMLVAGPNGSVLRYDPAGRLHRVSGGGVSTLFQYDGINLVAEYSTTILQRRYVHGSGTDQPILWYDGIAVSAATRRYLMADERGSITSVSDNAGAILAINRYDEYGIPASTNLGRFGYTGQTWLPEIGMWHYRARIYSPTLGRFMQTDPIGYGDGMNMYAYVGGDPINYVDPLGLCEDPDPDDHSGDCIVTAPRQLSYSVCGGSGQMSCGDYMDMQIGFGETCRTGLQQANQDFGAVIRARAAMDTIRDAARSNGIDPRLLAAIGVRETGFRNVVQQGGGGRGVFQLDIRTGGYSEAEGMSVPISANLAAQHLRRDMNQISRQHPNLVQAGLATRATAAAYNFGAGNLSGNAATIDDGTARNNYGSSIENLMACFSLARSR